MTSLVCNNQNKAHPPQNALVEENAECAFNQIPPLPLNHKGSVCYYFCFCRQSVSQSVSQTELSKIRRKNFVTLTCADRHGERILMASIPPTGDDRAIASNCAVCYWHGRQQCLQMQVATMDWRLLRRRRRMRWTRINEEKQKNPSASHIMRMLCWLATTKNSRSQDWTLDSNSNRTTNRLEMMRGEEIFFRG